MYTIDTIYGYTEDLKNHNAVKSGEWALAWGWGLAWDSTVSSKQV